MLFCLCVDMCCYLFLNYCRFDCSWVFVLRWWCLVFVIVLLLFLFVFICDLLYYGLTLVWIEVWFILLFVWVAYFWVVCCVIAVVLFGGCLLVWRWFGVLVYIGCVVRLCWFIVVCYLDCVALIIVLFECGLSLLVVVSLGFRVIVICCLVLLLPLVVLVVVVFRFDLSGLDVSWWVLFCESFGFYMFVLLVSHLGGVLVVLFELLFGFGVWII